MTELQAGLTAFYGKDNAACRAHYEKAAAAANGRARAEALQTAGSCALKLRAADDAARLFEKAVEAHLSYCEDVFPATELDEQLSAGARSKWDDVKASYRSRCALYESKNDPAIRALFDADQKDREGGANDVDFEALGRRDAERFARAGGLDRPSLTADDLYRLAMIYQHGETPEMIARSHDLAVRAVVIDGEFVKARWLAAASSDRERMYREQPQLYATQFKRVEDKWVLWDVDPTVTDEMRAVWCTPPLQYAKEQVARLNQRQ